MGFYLNQEIQPRFELGETIATDGVFAFAAKHDIDLAPYFERHRRGDWGMLCEEDKTRNEKAVKEGNTIYSAYLIDLPGQKPVTIWLITEHDRSVTTILFPSEY